MVKETIEKVKEQLQQNETDRVDWRKEYDNKQAECVKYIEALDDIRKDERLGKIKAKVDELFTLIRDMDL